MEVWKRGLIFVTFFMCCLGVALLTGAMGTKYWLESEPVRELHFNASSPTGYIHFGLFSGTKQLNYGIGVRRADIWIKAEMNADSSFMYLWLWVITILVLTFAILFGLVSAAFAVINTATNPIETITGTQGLYLWNGLAVLFSILTILSWIVHFFIKLKDNVMTRDEINAGWTSVNRSRFGYSFILVVAAMVIFCINIGLVIFVRWEAKEKKTKKPIDDKSTDGGIMLY